MMRLSTWWLLPLVVGCTRPSPPAATAPGERGAGAAEVAPELGAATHLKRILAARRSVREFDDRPLSREDLEELSWAGAGVSRPGEAAGREGVTGLRTAPSAGARYPLELFVVAERVDGMRPGLYRYRPEDDDIVEASAAGPLGADLARVALDQRSIASAVATVVLAADVSRTAARYGSRARRYVHMEAGHAAQNILLTATARGLGACPIGAFDDDAVSELLDLDTALEPLYLIPVGTPRADAP